MKRTISRLWRSSIWGQGAVSPADARVDGLLRRSIPRFYIAVAVFGLFGALGGTPALRQTFGDPYAHAWSFLVTLTALACLLGLAYPAHLWRVEAIAAMALNGWIFLYIVALIAASTMSPDIGRLGVGAVLFALTELPWWRVQDIYRDRKKNGWQ